MNLSTKQIIRKVLSQEIIPTPIFVYAICTDPVAISLQFVREIFISRNLI